MSRGRTLDYGVFTIYPAKTMAASIEVSGDIEIFCCPGGAVTRQTVPFYDSVTEGDQLSLVFGPPDGGTSPDKGGSTFTLRITSPSGSTIVDSILRDLPTGTPQSPPPVDFVVSSTGVYVIEIGEIRGRSRGEARVHVTT